MCHFLAHRCHVLLHARCLKLNATLTVARSAPARESSVSDTKMPQTYRNRGQQRFMEGLVRR